MTLADARLDAFTRLSLLPPGSGLAPAVGLPLIAAMRTCITRKTCWRTISARAPTTTRACRTALSLRARLCWMWALGRASWRYLRRALVGGCWVAGTINMSQHVIFVAQLGVRGWPKAKCMCTGQIHPFTCAPLPLPCHVLQHLRCDVEHAVSGCLLACTCAPTPSTWCSSPPPPGARKVYAVEATDMAKFAQRLVAAQGLEGTVEVIQGVIESVELPEKVDIIISEWMVSTAGPAGAATARSSCTAW